jgi:hypothetical protein
VGRLTVNETTGKPLPMADRVGAVAGLHDIPVCLSGRAEPTARGVVLYVAARMIKAEAETMADLAAQGIGGLTLRLESADTPPRFRPAVYHATMPAPSPADHTLEYRQS